MGHHPDFYEAARMVVRGVLIYEEPPIGPMPDPGIRISVREPEHRGAVQGEIHRAAS